MTSEQLEHLRLIDAHLERLLDIAAKRTPWEWETLGIANSNSLRLFAGNIYLGVIGNSDADKREVQSDATFIASCAGNAEAGWRATRAAIAGYLKASTDDSWAVSLVASEVLESILADFPLELVKP